MQKKLLTVFASGLILSVVSFGGAWAVGGDTLKNAFQAKNGWHWTFSDDEDEIAEGPSKTRQFPLEAGSQLVMEIPVELDFTRGDTSEMTVTGPAELVDRLVWNNGHLSIQGTFRTSSDLKVRITSPEIAGLDLNAPGDVRLTGLDQKALTLNSRGAIDLEGSGRVDQVSISSSGAGDIDLGKLTNKDATVRIKGVGDVTLSSTGTVDIDIKGAGDVTLLRKPTTLKTNIQGVGNVNHDY